MITLKNWDMWEKCEAIFGVKKAERKRERALVKLREHALSSVMASVGLFIEGPSILAKTAMAAVNPVSGGPSTIFSSPGQCWHFNYCWVNSFAPMKAVRPNRICRLPDLWTHVTRYNRGKAKALSSQPLLLSITSITYPSVSPIVNKHKGGSEKEKNRTPQLNTFLSPRQVLIDLKGTPSDIIAVKGQSLSLA